MWSSQRQQAPVRSPVETQLLVSDGLSLFKDGQPCERPHYCLMATSFLFFLFFHILSSSYRLLCSNFVTFQAFLNNCFPCLTCIQEELNGYRSRVASFHTEIYKAYLHEACEKSESPPMQRKAATPHLHFAQEVQEKPNRKRKR